MANVFDTHPWLTGAAGGMAGAFCTAIANSLIGRARRLLTSPDRQDFQDLEVRLAGQITALQASMAAGMKDLESKVAGVYERIDEKTDALNERIDTIVLKQSGGR